jgi:hypothetical protein
MISRVVERLKYLISSSSLLKDNNGSDIIQTIKEVDDLDAYTDELKVFPSVGISRNAGEHIEYHLDNRGVRSAHCTFAIRVYTKSQASPEAARKVLDITVWKVAQALLGNPCLTFTEFDPQEYLINSDVVGITYGSKRLDKVSYEYATIQLDTERKILDPVPDTDYYTVLHTMIHSSFTGGNVVVTETTE